jgi:hypothetical protein
MAPAKKQAAKKATPGAALVKWDEKFAKFAAAGVEKEKNLGGGASLKFSPGAITYNGANMPGGKLNVIILESAFLNAWYKSTYNQDNPTSPECFALALDDGDLAPHEKSTDPQSDTCANCEQNAWGSAATGRGKACGNKRRLAILAASDCEDGEGTAAAEMITATLSPTTLKAWAGYVRAVADQHSRPTWAVVTEISNVLDPGQTPSFHIEFALVDLITDEDVLVALEKRLAAAQELVLRPFEPTPEPIGKPPQKGNVGKSQKFAAKPVAKAAQPVTKAPVRGRR